MQFHKREKDYTDLRDVLADIPERAMVLLGAPGCGKSTLLRRLQLDETRQCLAEGSEKVSLFVSLGAYSLDRELARNAPCPLDWLQAQRHRQAPCLPELAALLAERRVKEFLHLNAADHASAAWVEIRDDSRLVDLYSTPYFLKLLSGQLAYDPRVASERAALFTGFLRRALERC